jgi:hypothetical protein
MDPGAAPRARQGLAVACSLGAAAFSVIPFLLSLLFGAAECGDSCNSGRTDYILILLGGAVFVAGIILVVFVVRGRPSAAAMSFSIALMSLLLLAAWSGVGLHTNFVRLGMQRFLLLVGPVFLGALAVFLTESRSARER